MEVLLIVLLASSMPLFCVCFDFKLVDLSYSYNNDTISYSANAPFRSEEHPSTYMDAPYHFHKSGHTIDEIPIERFFVTGILIDATLETGTDYGYKLPEQKLIEWERLHGVMPDDSLVFVNFGLANKSDQNGKLQTASSGKDFQFPGLSREAALWLTKTKRVVGVAVDSPTLDQDADVMLAENDIYTIKNVNLSESSLPPRFQAIAMPMKLKNGSAAPVRVVAIYSSVDD